MTFTAYVTRLGKRLDPPVSVHLHLLRHFAASHLSGSADPRTVADQLGNDPKILLDTYSHSIYRSGQERPLSTWPPWRRYRRQLARRSAQPIKEGDGFGRSD